MLQGGKEGIELGKGFAVGGFECKYNIITSNMDEIEFDWDELKAITNERKHGVSFEEAQTVFYDEAARLSYDPNHSQTEDRYLILGMSDLLRLLVVCHSYQPPNELIRIISARQATKQERQQYQEFLR